MLKDALKIIRKHHQLDQKRVEELTGISKSNLSILESGRTKPTVQTLEKLAAAYCCRVSVIFTVSEMLDDIGYSGEFTPKINDSLFSLMRNVK
jgi:transcriptional regulator with XRE-family HTH domain